MLMEKILGFHLANYIFYLIFLEPKLINVLYSLYSHIIYFTPARLSYWFEQSFLNLLILGSVPVRRKFFLRMFVYNLHNIQYFYFCIEGVSRTNTEIFRDILRQRGPSGLFAGLTPRILKVYFINQ